MFRAAGVPAGRYTVDTVERDYAESLEVVALADVLLHPSRSEGFGMLVLEAQHVGVPVITTRRGAMKDYTMHGAIPASRRVEAPSTRVVYRNDGSGWFLC